MPFDVRLKSIQFRTTNNPYLSYVSCILSNNQHSPVFEHGGEFKNYEYH